MCLHDAQHLLELPQDVALRCGIGFLGGLVNREDEVGDGVRVGLHGGLQAPSEGLQDGEGEVGGEGVGDDGEEELDERPEVPVGDLLICIRNGAQTLHIFVKLNKLKFK